MLNKDFENFELRLKRLREESQEDFESAEKIFQESYNGILQEVFTRDILGMKKYISGFFTLEYVDALHSKNTLDKPEIFSHAVQKSLGLVPLNNEKKNILQKNILQYHKNSTEQEKVLGKKGDISRDPFFVLVEDFSRDGDISQEEFLLLQHRYTQEKDFIAALESLPSQTRELFHAHISALLHPQQKPKQDAFESEYHVELQALSKKGYNIFPVVQFVARSYYMSPGKLKKYEHPGRRLRRTFKMALLRLLRLKLGNIDAENILERFENGEYFEDFFFLIYKLLEVVDENPAREEIYSILKLEEDTQSLVYDAEATKKKILDGEKVTARISNLIGETESQMEEGILTKILEDDTHFIGEEIHFAHGDDEMAGIYAETQKEEQKDEFDYDTMSPQTAYEILKREFQKCEEEKRQAFGSGNYDTVDTINERLLRIQSKLEKLSQLLGIEL